MATAFLFKTATGLAAAGTALFSATIVAAGDVRPPVEAGDGSSNSGLIVLLVIGALMLINGTAGSARIKTPAETESDDDVIMKF